MAPTVSIFYGTTVSINYRDHNPPHCHAKYGEFKAIYNLETGDMIKGNFPKGQKKMLEKWIKRYKKELLKNWELASKGKQTFKISGRI